MKKSSDNCKVFFKQSCFPPFLPNNLESVCLVGSKWQEDDVDKVIIYYIAGMGCACKTFVSRAAVLYPSKQRSVVYL